MYIESKTVQFVLCAHRWQRRDHSSKGVRISTLQGICIYALRVYVYILRIVVAYIHVPQGVKVSAHASHYYILDLIYLYICSLSIQFFFLLLLLRCIANDCEHVCVYVFAIVFSLYFFFFLFFSMSTGNQKRCGNIFHVCIIAFVLC